MSREPYTHGTFHAADNVTGNQHGKARCPDGKIRVFRIIRFGSPSVRRWGKHVTGYLRVAHGGVLTFVPYKGSVNFWVFKRDIEEAEAQIKDDDQVKGSLPLDAS